MRGPNLTNDERHKIVCFLFENIEDGRPKRGSMNTLATKYQVDRKTIFQVWKVARQQRNNGEDVQVQSKLKGKTGRHTLEVPVERILATKLEDRGSLLTFGKAIGVSPTTIAKWVKEGKIRSHTSSLRPYLTDENKFKRLQFALSHLRYDRISNSLMFKDMLYIIHIDEKWFFITQDQHKFFLLQEEDDPHKPCKSKSFITKVMFMAAVSRPIYDANGTLIFDGKIGIFPFTFEEPAKRSSKNRPAGTPETKSIPSITKQVTKEMLLTKILPAIKNKWPAGLSKNISIQQDNAKPHTKNEDPEFKSAATSDGFNITLTQQPANSPDLNVLDLGFFRSIQTLQQRKRAKTIDELVNNVMEAWDEEPAQCLSDVWLSLQACMLEVLKRKGYNDYKLPHLAKKAQRLAGTLPTNLSADENLVRECLQHLHDAGKDIGLEEISVSLAFNNPL